jgi:hypothetical protein
VTTDETDSRRVPLLVQAGDGAVAMFVPFIYVQLKLRHRAYNTAAAHLRAIQAFYIKVLSTPMSASLIASMILAIRALKSLRSKHMEGP